MLYTHNKHFFFSFIHPLQKKRPNIALFDDPDFKNINKIYPTHFFFFYKLRIKY